MSGVFLAVFFLAVTVRIARAFGFFGGIAPTTRIAPLPGADDPRWSGQSGGEQLTGKSCAECNHRIMMESEGRRCKKCRAPLHKKACSKRHKALAHPLAGPAPYR